MPQLIWTPNALLDMQRLYRFLASKSTVAAGRAVRAIRAGVKLLPSHPHIGRNVDEMGQGFREWLVDFGSSGYVVLYKLEGDKIYLLAVRHQREVGYIGFLEE